MEDGEDGECLGRRGVAHPRRVGIRVRGFNLAQVSHLGEREAIQSPPRTGGSSIRSDEGILIMVGNTQSWCVPLLVVFEHGKCRVKPGGCVRRRAFAVGGGLVPKPVLQQDGLARPGQ